MSAVLTYDGKSVIYIYLARDDGKSVTQLEAELFSHGPISGDPLNDISG